MSQDGRVELADGHQRLHRQDREERLLPFSILQVNNYGFLNGPAAASFSSLFGLFKRTIIFFKIGMMAPDLLPHPPQTSLGTGGLSLALGLVTSCCGCQTA